MDKSVSIISLSEQDKLFPYAEDNVKSFLDSEWENEDVKKAVIALRKLAVEDKENSVEGVVSIPGEVNYFSNTFDSIIVNLFILNMELVQSQFKKFSGCIKRRSD